MFKEFIGRLRDCSSEDRKEIAMEIARSGDNNASLKALVQMANGVQSYKSRWKNFGFRRPVEYFELEDQLIAVDALAEQGSEWALNYLCKLNRADSIEHQVRELIYQSDGQILDDGTELEWHHPWARGEIGKALDSNNREVKQRIRKAIDRCNR